MAEGEKKILQKNENSNQTALYSGASPVVSGGHTKDIK